jgi:hypothetical protein
MCQPVVHQTDRTVFTDMVVLSIKCAVLYGNYTTFKPSHRHVISIDAHPLEWTDTFVMAEQIVLLEWLIFVNC